MPQPSLHNMANVLPISTVPLKGENLSAPGSANKMNHTYNEPGYQRTVFPGKQEQLTKVIESITAKGFIPKDLVPAEVAWFYK